MKDIYWYTASKFTFKVTNTCINTHLYYRNMTTLVDYISLVFQNILPLLQVTY